MKKKFGAVVVAAGNSTRMGGARSKVLEELGGRPVLLWSLEALCSCGEIGEIVVVCRDGDKEAMEQAAHAAGLHPRFVSGGAERQDSVRAGVEALAGHWEYLLIHDGARPFLSPELIGRVCAGALAHGAAAAALPVTDTVKLVEQGFVTETPPREKLYAVQTPQAFERNLYLYALRRAESEGKRYTDDCQLIEASGGRICLVEGDERNRKITTPYDLEQMRYQMKQESARMRVGQGYDVHRLVEGRKLILGGVEIPFVKGLLGHSDADVLTHALCDALLGAAALGDIGHLFPDDDPRYAGADSLKLLAEVCRLVRERGWKIVNADCTLIAQRPKVAPYIEAMREKIAAACGVEPDRISVKATTEEGLGFTGSGEGMAASAIALLEGQE